MGDYYNATRGPLPATLVDGSPVSFGPKSWQYIPPENEGSASIAKLLEKKFLVRSVVPRTAPPVEVKPAEAKPADPVAEAKPGDVPGDVPAEAAKPIEAKAEASTSSMKEEISKKKR